MSKLMNEETERRIDEIKARDTGKDNPMTAVGTCFEDRRYLLELVSEQAALVAELEAGLAFITRQKDEWHGRASESVRLRRERDEAHARIAELESALREMVNRWEPDGGSDKRIWDRAAAALAKIDKEGAPMTHEPVLRVHEDRRYLRGLVAELETALRLIADQTICPELFPDDDGDKLCVKTAMTIAISALAKVNAP